MFASSFRLDLGITIGPRKPGHIKTILSGYFLPILIDYRNYHLPVPALGHSRAHSPCLLGLTCLCLTGSALWRLRAALKHPDRVRGITFSGSSANFDKFFKLTNHPLPILESLILRSGDRVNPPDSFLRGPLADTLDLHHLRRLTLLHVSFPSISRILASATALTDLTLIIDTAFGPSQETSLLTCLQSMPCLRNLDLGILSTPLNSQSQTLTSNTIVPLSKLTCFHYNGYGVFLDILVSGFSAPSIRDVRFEFADKTWRWPPNMHLSRFFNEMDEDYHTVDVACHGPAWFHVSWLSLSEYKPRFEFFADWRDSGEMVTRMCNALSTKFATVEKLCVTFELNAIYGERFSRWRKFLQHFTRIKALRTGFASCQYLARVLLHQDHEETNDDDLGFLPALEVIELEKSPSSNCVSQHGLELAVFEPFISAHQQKGRPVKVFFTP
jgi:plasmid maintenance system antidote protein VapI